MHIAYLVITILVALANSYAASLNFAGAESVKVVADHVQVSQKWMIPFGILLASGAVGLLVGFAVPALVICSVRLDDPQADGELVEGFWPIDGGS